MGNVVNMNKYEIIMSESVTIGDAILYRVRALKDSKFFKAGDIGGYIEKLENLSMSGDARVFGDAQVCDNAQVFGNAQVYGDARSMVTLRSMSKNQ